MVSKCKEFLVNIHGFSPYQLATGTNPKLPSIHKAKALVLTFTPRNQVICKNLKAIQKARETFIASENSEKLRRALSHNTRTSGDIKYLTGDYVYFKRLDSKSWHDPVKVLGQDGQQVLKTEADILRCIPVPENSLTTTMKINQAISLNVHQIHHSLNINLLTPRIQLPFNNQLMNQIQMMILIINVQTTSVTLHLTYRPNSQLNQNNKQQTYNSI